MEEEKMLHECSNCNHVDKGPQYSYRNICGANWRLTEPNSLIRELFGNKTKGTVIRVTMPNDDGYWYEFRKNW